MAYLSDENVRSKAGIQSCSPYLFDNSSECHSFPRSGLFILEKLDSQQILLSYLFSVLLNIGIMVTYVKIVESVRGCVVGSFFLKKSLCGVIKILELNA